jgi:hypothetical protein
MMKLVKMMREGGDDAAGGDAANDPEYPFGLRITLYKEDLEKLGIAGDDLSVGAEVAIEARATVVMYSEEQSVGGEPECTVELQITDMAIGDAPEQRRRKTSDRHLTAVGGRTDSY